MGIIAWLVVGGLAGWIASIIMGKNASMGLIANIIVGIVGALVAGFVLRLFGIDGVTGFNIWSILVAIGGACLLLFIVRLVKR
ncbi:MAG TPA: GlsB/YeaQ/YmgE family stress response membrane protein [Spirochaetota bacterium]|nr:GlsB/YeaQ/YmgE family stress response membrane protein [Spirochaetota bacterium]HOD15888.1 GlsB/YeaQ/YmgE family stress response membrane protein [Spirochaetota bacterium]HPG50973.1 GlsB/YeaQ/YmgE family stress response membrane protein [Spirochaetota bacterium]HPN11627.1 GlsB/YeaQ/YmgE family stress response membrane protein [Spirochaetota bacterium]HQL80913.1 GlsB/YeaQ/YmgE family stress response membrane protein [Spirochaetota bacterium]